MRFGLVALKNVCDINGFEEAMELRLVAGNPGQVYFRLVDLDRRVSADQGAGYLRFVPASGATMSMTIGAIDSNSVVTRSLSNPFSDDRSIWLLPILASDQLAFGSMEAALTIGANQYKVPIVSAVVDDPTGTSKFFC
jgi:hypothetical protein